MDDTAV